MPTSSEPAGNRLRVLVVHNRYQQRGGEDVVVDAESELLGRHGYAVERYIRTNDEIGAGRSLGSLGLVLDTHWSRRAAYDVARRIAAFAPDVVHVHNTFPLVSSSVLWAAARARVPVVQTIHNFRAFCLQAMFLRDGAVCEDCLGRLPWRGVTAGCYRGSVAQSMVLASSLTLHRALGTQARTVARFIALSSFARTKLIAGGLPAARIVVKPNFIDLPAPAESRRGGALFVGRLAAEKGIETLVGALERMPEVRMRVLGDGPERARFAHLANAELAGRCEPAEVYERMREAAYLVMPSVSYEGFPRTIAEAFACGLPVIASRIGSLAEIVEDGVHGLLVEPRSSEALAAAINWAERNPAALARMGANARREYERRYTGERNQMLIGSIYGEAMALEKENKDVGARGSGRGAEVW